MTLPELTASEGKVILAWYYDAELTNLFSATNIITSDLTLYAAEKDKASALVNGEPAEDGVSGAVGGASGEYTSITLTDNSDVKKLTFPKTKDAKEITIDGNGNTLDYSGAELVNCTVK